MKKILFLLLLLPILARATNNTNILILTWNEPPGFSSRLYTTTNLTSAWTEVGTVQPPYQTQATNQLTFFYVHVEPTNHFNSILLFSINPNEENLRPTYTNQPALAYENTGFYGLWTWSVLNQQWQ